MKWLGMTVLCAALWAVPVAGIEAETLLRVTGEGRVQAEPDMAVLSLEVSRDAGSATAATMEMADAAQAVLAALEAQGVAERDIQTSTLRLSPRWSRPDDGRVPRLVGYTARTGLTVRLRDLDSFGAVLDAVVSDGANGFGGIRFAVSEPRPFEDAARLAAFEDAMAKVQLYAQAAGLEVAEIRSISEGGGLRPMPMMEASMARAAPLDMPVAAGELDVVMQVSLDVVLAPAVE